MTIGALILRTLIFAAFFSATLFWSRTIVRDKFDLDASTPFLIWFCVVIVGIASFGKIVGDAWLSLIFGFSFIPIIWLGVAVDKSRGKID